MNRNIFVVIAVLVVAFLVVSSYKISAKTPVKPMAVKTTPTPTPFQAVGKTIKVALQAQNNSKQSGATTITELDSSVLVTVQLDNAKADSVMPVAIYSGICSS